MKKTIFLILLLGLIVFSSCSTSIILKSEITPNEVKDVQYLEPATQISLILKGNMAYYNDSLSFESKQLMLKSIDSLKLKIPITGVILVSDTAIKHKLEKEIEFLCVSASYYANITNLKVTPIIDSLLKAKGKRFGLITFSKGFTRSKKNYSNQKKIEYATAVLSLGMYIREPIKANSTIYAMIVDTKENNNTFFRKSFLNGKEPLDESVIKMQLNRIFRKYYY